MFRSMFTIAGKSFSPQYALAMQEITSPIRPMGHRA
jgi:hypothetical protein